MSDVAIKVEGLGKQYRIGAQQARYRTIRETIADTVKAPFQRLASMARGQSLRTEDNTIWALKDVSFEVKHGEVLGIIGRNGAGKTTLLKILSRITKPTEGYVDINGRVGSLLEVGTGFHPELTGRENIFLNGAILGMKKTEIERKFDEIVAFAEIEKFLDTPVKRYSSGMYVRLAFSVAAHLEPEILLVDEVLAVGDAAFQKKSLGKMGDVAEEGRTVLFVSHNMSVINELCPKSILLRDGSIARIGKTRDITDYYLSSLSNIMDTPLGERRDRSGNGKIKFVDVAILANGVRTGTILGGQDIEIEIEYIAKKILQPKSVRFAISISSRTGIKFISFDSMTTQLNIEKIGLNGILRCTIPGFPLTQGQYQGLLFAELDGVTADRLPDAFQFEVISGRYPNVGWISVPHKWDHIQLEQE